jgi:hypothetical protein
MRTFHRIEPGRRLRHPVRGFPLRRLWSPESDTSLDYRERTISRTEVADLANGLISAEAVHVRAVEQAASRARTASRDWSGLGVRR